MFESPDQAKATAPTKLVVQSFIAIHQFHGHQIRLKRR
jgi:hypothetical protein